MAVDSGTTIRPYHDADVPQLVELFARVFGARITADHWRWKLTGNPAPACNVWLAVAGERPVFQYAGIAQRYWLDGREVTAMVSVDTMTDPDFRRRGLLTRVAAEAYAAWRTGGAGFVIGLPNQQWGSRTGALGWVELFGLQWMALPLRPSAVAARRLKLPWLRHAPFVDACWNAIQSARRRVDTRIIVSEVETADAGFDDLWQRLRVQQLYSAIRDRRWIEWRFLASPLRHYQVLAARRDGSTLGYLAYRLVESEGRVSSLLAELITANEAGDVRDALLSDHVRRMRAAGAESIVTLAVPGSSMARWLARRGFFRGSGFSVQLVPLAEALPLESLRDPSAWLLTGADFDVI